MVGGLTEWGRQGSAAGSARAPQTKNILIRLIGDSNWCENRIETMTDTYDGIH